MPADTLQPGVPVFFATGAITLARGEDGARVWLPCCNFLLPRLARLSTDWAQEPFIPLFLRERDLDAELDASVPLQPGEEAMRARYTTAYKQLAAAKQAVSDSHSDVESLQPLLM